MSLLWLSLAFIIGIVLGNGTGISWWIWAAAAGFFLSLYLLPRFFKYGQAHNLYSNRNFPLSPLLFLVTLCLGSIRYASSIPKLTPSDLAWYNNRGVFEFFGTISAPPDVRADKTLYEIDITEITDLQATAPNRTIQVSGTALVTTTRFTHWEYGDQLRFRGEPRTPAVFPDFSYKDYLARQRIFSVIYYPVDSHKVGTMPASAFRRGLLSFREKARLTIFSLFPQPESGLLVGILLGIENYLPPSLGQAYRDTGTAHIIAISGFNMTIIATLLIFVFTRFFRPFVGVILAIAGIALYSVFVDGSASVIRAAIMSSAAAVGHLIGRRQSGLHALLLTAALMCLFNPNLPWDVSFQLSFMATLGLVLFAQPMQDTLRSILEKRFGEERAARISSPVSEYFLFTLAAQFTTLPVIAVQFHRVSMVSLLANPLILPAQPILLVMGMVTTLAGLIIPVVGKTLAMLTWPILKYTNFIVAALGKIKGGAMNLHPATGIWILAIVILVLIAFILRNFFKKKLGSPLTIWAFVLLFAGCFSVWSIYFHRPDGLLHIHQVRSAETSFLFIKTPAGDSYLVDLEGDADETAYSLTPFLSPWNYHLDGLVLTRPVSEVALSDLNDTLPVKNVMTANAILRPAPGEFDLSIPDSTILRNLSAIPSLLLEDGLSLTVIGETPGKAAYSLQYGTVNILIPAGVDYALLRDAHPGLLENTDLLILSPLDTAYIPPRLWSQLDPAYLLWNSLEPAPFKTLLFSPENEMTSLASDGLSLWVENP